MSQYNPYDEDFNDYINKFMESREIPFFDGVKKMEMEEDIEDFFEKYPDYGVEDFEKLTFKEGLKKIHDIIHK